MKFKHRQCEVKASFVGLLSFKISVYFVYHFQSFNEYFTSEHSRLLTLWRAVVAFRRQFSEMKIAAERDLASMKGDVQRTARSMHSACLNLSAHLRSDDTQAQVYIKPFIIRQNFFFLAWHTCSGTG